MKTPAAVNAVPEAGAATTAVSLSQLLSALSHALDLTEGQPPGHTLRSCAIGMRIGEAIGLDSDERSALYYALLLKDAGCSSNAERFASLFGAADQKVKYRMKFGDWHHRLRLAVRTARTVGVGRSLPTRVRHFLQIAGTQEMTRNLIRIRCDRGAGIALHLGFPAATADAIRNLDEHWCGLGYPEGRHGEAIPLLARIANLAQCVEIFHTRDGSRRALRIAKTRSGTWFDPQLVDVLLDWERDRDWWAELRGPEILERVVAAEPHDRRRTVDDAGLDAVASAFADIVDAKSPFTFRHSTNVALYAVAIAEELGMSAAERRRLFRAGLLHDIGKLGISSGILEKRGPLTPEERREMEAHPLYSWQILSRVDAFREFARMASLHHEKLDGSGYPWGVTGEDLDPAARILCVADIYEALTADRPYRAGMTPAAALAIIHKDSGPRLCADSVAGLDAWVAAGGGHPDACDFQ
ncbi:MAG TPA: HD domain-containing phosphohydrolase [Longimicrobiaceae bacterium]|nr:HD domain-containing phosphohydrolase [Longimicrobiaceae bacterium]